MVAALIGATVGVAELVAKYRDAPLAAIRTWPAALYLVLNGAAAILAFGLLLATGWRLMPETVGATGVAWAEAVVAGLAAMAVLRVSLMTRIGGESTAVGPGPVLRVFLDAADRAVDRERAEHRSRVVREVMAGVSFERAKDALPAYCEPLMQGLDPQALGELRKGVQRLAEAQLEDRVKALTLGAALLNVFGERVVREAVSALGEEIKEGPLRAEPRDVRP